MSDLTLASREAGLMWTGNGNGSKNREADYYVQPQCSGVGLEDDSGQANTVKKRKRNLPGNPDPDAEVIALSPRTLMATNRFVCEVCNKGFQRDQNLQLHKRGHNLPWKLRQRTSMDIKKRVYICPEPSCVHHNASRALGDLTGIKKHFCRKHGEKKWKCERCPKRYAVQSDWKAHTKTCGTREYRCDCGIIFSRRDSFITHRAFCCALAEDNARLHFTGSNTNHIIMPPNQNPSSSNKSSTLLNPTSYFNPSSVIPLIEQHAFRQSAQLSQHQQNRAGLNSNYLSSFENTVIPSDLHFNLKKHMYPPSGFNATTLTHAPQQKHEQLSELGNLIARPCNEEQSSMFTLDTMQQQSISAVAGRRTSISASTFGSTSASTSATARTFPALDFHHKVSPMGATFPSQKGMSLSNTVPNIFEDSNVKLPLNTSLDAATSTTHGMPSRMNPNAYLREPPCLLRNLQVAHSDSDEATAILSGYGGMLLNQHSYRGMSNNNNSMRGMGVFQPSFSNSSFLSSIARKEEVLTRDFLHSGRATHGIGLLSTVPQREEMMSLGQFPNMSAAAASISDNDNKAAVVMRQGRHEEEEEDEEEEEPYESISNGFAEHPSMHNHCTSFSSGRPWLG